ncbi:hypothetical protein RUM44_004255 [Polyplax serrata]|uniref:BTB domain-containing protein n=1 Tax=Polyplax serrata TaxID=468196 RepID=A0ABR1B3V9_POLSC
MDPPQRFCVRWNSYKSNLQTAFPKLLTSEHFVDVTLACEKQFIKCHKIVLSACSVYFETLLVNNPCQHPIIFMKDVEFWEIKALVEFMYKGEVNVSQNQLDSLLKSAESLQIRGLSGTKQFANFDQSEESREDCMSDGKTKRNKHDSEEEGQEEVSRKKRKKGDDDDKYIQITSVQLDDSSKSKTSDDNDNDENQVIKQESIEIEDYQFDNSEMGAGDDGDEDECYHRGAFRTGRSISSDMAGPSGISVVQKACEIEVLRVRNH